MMMAALLQMTWQPHNTNNSNSCINNQQQQPQQHHQRRCRSSPPLGLKNLGNTCYLNSVLQCLTYTPPLAQFCLASQHSSLCKSLCSNQEQECPFCILERQIARSLSLESQPVDSPAKIQKCINLFAENFQLGRQEDAHEFLRYVIDACHNTCLKLIKKLSSSSSPASSSVMKEIFGGALLSQVKCLSCRGESNKTDNIMDISLDLYQSNSLRDALGKFFQPELLDGNNKYNCSKCKKLSVAKKQMFILRAPNVLVIQLKRFEGIHGGKIDRYIEVEEALLLSKFMCSTSQDLQPAYNLFGSIVHTGFSPESGHYYAYIKDPTGRWYCCNDSQVTLSNTREVLSEKVYILFYLRNNQIPRASKVGFPCSTSPYDSNVNEVQMNGILSNAPVVRTNGVVCSANVSTFSKNGKISAHPYIIPFNIKKPEVRRAITNGNGNLGAHSNGYVDKYGDRSLSVTKKPSLHDNDSGGKNMIENKAELSSSKSSSLFYGDSSDFLENGKKQKPQLTIGNGCSNHLKESMNNEIATQSLAVVNRELGDRTFNQLSFENDSVITSPKRKLSVMSVVGSCKMLRKTCSKELEKFKEEIASEASSDLRSGGWVDKVHNYMHAQKRLCIQASGSCADNTKLRSQLIADAKMTFLLQIPQSLKEHLVGRLRSFCQDNRLFEA